MCSLSHLQACVAAQWMVALDARRHLPTEFNRWAGFNRRHYFELVQTGVPLTGPPPRGALCTKDVSDLQRVSLPGNRSPAHPLPARRMRSTLPRGRMVDVNAWFN